MGGRGRAAQKVDLDAIERGLDDIEAGREARVQRVYVRHPYQTMNERASDLGITEKQLSDWENYGIRWPGMPLHTTHPLDRVEEVK